MRRLNLVFNKQTFNSLLFFFIFFISIIKAEFYISLVAFCFAVVFLLIDLRIKGKKDSSKVNLEESLIDFEFFDTKNILP